MLNGIPKGYMLPITVTSGFVTLSSELACEVDIFDGLRVVLTVIVLQRFTARKAGLAHVCEAGLSHE